MSAKAKKPKMKKIKCSVCGKVRIKHRNSSAMCLTCYQTFRGVEIRKDGSALVNVKIRPHFLPALLELSAASGAFSTKYLSEILEVFVVDVKGSISFNNDKWEKLVMQARKTLEERGMVNDDLP